jgi:hypothetical protein
MLDLFQEFIMPLFFQTKEQNKLVNKMTLYVTKEVVTYVETEEGEIKKQISRIETPKMIIYEGKVSMDPNKIRKFLSDPIHYPQSEPDVLEQAIQFEQRDMISNVYDMINNTLDSFTASSRIILNSVTAFFSNPFSF